jgi:hypothetical protein
MSWLRIVLSPSYWKYGYSWKRALVGFLSALGTLWLIVEAGTFVSQPLADWVRGHWYPFLAVAVCWGIWQTRPRYFVCHRLQGRDLMVEVRVGDLFKQSGDLIVGCNTTFDTDFTDGLVSPSSVQGQFTKTFYDDVRHLDRDIDVQLEGIKSQPAPENKPGKQRSYPVGTIVRVRARGRNIYLVALATINAHGRAQASFEDLKVCLASLWEFIGSRGDRNSLVMPVLGTGYSRLTQSRSEIVREIINSFVAGCAARGFCEKLTIVIPARDFYQHDVNIEELGTYLRHVCAYTQYAAQTTPLIGTSTS